MYGGALGARVLASNTAETQEVQMSGIAHPHVPVSRQTRKGRLIVAGVLLALLMLTLVIWLTSAPYSAQPPAQPVQATHYSGPNEAARGNAVAEAAGSDRPTAYSGPDEAARGNAVAQAATP
jgi:hypothetical protein